MTHYIAFRAFAKKNLAFRGFTVINIAVSIITNVIRGITMTGTKTADLLTKAMGERSIHQASQDWGVNWHTLKAYLEGKVPNRESMIRVLASNDEIDQEELRAAIDDDIAKTGAA